jgi:hypothetical protein
MEQVASLHNVSHASPTYERCQAQNQKSKERRDGVQEGETEAMCFMAQYLLPHIQVRSPAVLSRV